MRGANSGSGYGLLSPGAASRTSQREGEPRPREPRRPEKNWEP
jgi:hypothetical protein